MFGTSGYVPISNPLDLPDLVPGPDVAAFEALGGATTASGIPPDQFTLFQLMPTNSKVAVADLHGVEPALKGSDEKPDAQARIELVSFQIAGNENLDPKMQATLRLDMGMDPSSSAQQDPLMWSIAAGLDLAAQAVSKDPKEKAADLSQPFRRRPIEIPGGLGQLRIELVAHEPPPWWRKIFSFVDNAAVRKLVSAVGFPGIALDAVKLLDEVLGRFEQAAAKPIFASRPLTVALTERAASEFSGGLDTAKAAILNDGLFVLSRHRDADLLRNEPPLYLGGYGKLVPRKAWDGQKLTVGDDPYVDLSYAILRVKTREVAAEKGL